MNVFIRKFSIDISLFTPFHTKKYANYFGKNINVKFHKYLDCKSKDFSKKKKDIDVLMFAMSGFYPTDNISR